MSDVEIPSRLSCSVKAISTDYSRLTQYLKNIVYLGYGFCISLVGLHNLILVSCDWTCKFKYVAAENSAQKVVNNNFSGCILKFTRVAFNVWVTRFLAERLDCGTQYKYLA